MRAALRLLANVKPARYLEAGAPTGLTGLSTHPTPRSHLLYLYRTTLDKLQKLPEGSVYRQSTEALTRHRLQIVESTVPEGLKEWQEKAEQKIAVHPEYYADIVHETSDGNKNIVIFPEEEYDEREVEWDGAEVQPGLQEGPYETKTKDVKQGGPVEQNRQAFDQLRASGGGKQVTQEARAGHEEGKGIRSEELNQPLHDANKAPEKAPEGQKRVDPVQLSPEPQLTADQVSDIESKIGAGLIEEVVQVAQGELNLVDSMAESKVWEDLTEKAPEGQWSYFERGTHTSTQKP